MNMDMYVYRVTEKQDSEGSGEPGEPFEAFNCQEQRTTPGDWINSTGVVCYRSPATIRRLPLRPTSVEPSAGFPKKAAVEPFPSFLTLPLPTEVEMASFSNPGSPSVEMCSLSETDPILDLKHNLGKV